MYTMPPLNTYNIMADELKMVDGYESAARYPTNPNTRCCLFDKNDNLFYVIETDQTGYKSSIGRYRFNPEPIEDVNDKKYASKEDFNSLKEMIENVQHTLQELSAGSERNDKSGSRQYTERKNKPNNAE